MNTVRPMRIVFGILLMLLSTAGLASDETTLFDSRGRAAAYIADDLTIYLWSGKPVAYLDRNSGGGFDVYGFNGKHLGWLSRGVVRDHQGNGACAIKQVLSTAEIEPIKSIKEIKPIKSVKEIGPILPIFSNSWSEAPCRLFLQLGAS
jgi:hypothetical protein